MAVNVLKPYLNPYTNINPSVTLTLTVMILALSLEVILPTKVAKAAIICSYEYTDFDELLNIPVHQFIMYVMSDEFKLVISLICFYYLHLFFRKSGKWQQ